MKRFLGAVIIFIMATLLHWIFVEIFSAFSITVGVMLAFSLIMASLLSESGGYTFAFISGLFLDFFASSMFGGYALVFTVMLFIFYKIDDKIDFREPGPQLVITALLNIASVLFYGILARVFTGAFVWQGITSLLAGSLVTALILPLLYLFITRYFKGSQPLY